MSKQHKWHKEIKAWADGIEIQWKAKVTSDEWVDVGDRVPMWHRLDVCFRIKPQPNSNLICKSCGQFLHETQIQIKEPQYLYVFCDHKGEQILRTHRGKNSNETYIGKIKLEQDDDNAS